MAKRRVIPCLDVKDGRIVKGVNFVQLRDAGDPFDAALAYQAAGADELVLLDISATAEGRSTMTGLIERIAAQLVIPLTVGGGVRSVDDFQRLIGAGADKVAVNSAAIARPQLLSEAAAAIGAERIVCAVDAKRRDKQEPAKGWEIWVAGGSKNTGLDAIDWAKRAAELGAGELLATSMDRDGTESGYDLALLRELAAAVSLPVIASGGVGTLDHLVEGVTEGHASAVLAASIFHFGKCTIADAKRALAAAGVDIYPLPTKE